MISQNKLLIFLFIFLFSFSVQTQADNLDNESALWPSINLQAPIYKQKISGSFLWQPAITDNFNEVGSWIYRGALIYNPRKNLGFWMGGDQIYSYTNHPKYLEGRTWQQITFDHKFKDLQINHRLRLEERYFPNANFLPLRNRYRIRLNHPIPNHDKWYILLSNELFTNLNSAGQFHAGFAEDRFIAALGRKLNKFAALETGYQLSLINRNRPQDNLARHSLILSLVINFPYSQSRK